jgi:1,4-dihydroxy-6-naphthoate synthase
VKGKTAPQRGAAGRGADEVLTVGYSPCPNDTFIFHALVTGAAPAPGMRWLPRLEDVETLNRLALEGALEVTKVSFHAYGHIRGAYDLLQSGSALGRGCGPLSVARSEAVKDRLEVSRIAIPGKLTSAALLLRLFAPGVPPSGLVEMPFDRILQSVEEGQVDAGLIIHESRFTYARRGLVALADLGEWWERVSGLPLPLGAIVARKDLGGERIRRVDEALRESVRRARRFPLESEDYVRSHAKEMDPAVLRAHIALYVNDFTEDLGEEGNRAVEALLSAAEARGVIPTVPGPDRREGGAGPTGRMGPHSGPAEKPGVEQ